MSAKNDDIPSATATETIWRSVGDASVSDRIKNEIVRVIRDRQLRPGDRLPAERELAALLQVSRPSVREAVRVLQAEGNLTVRHGAGVFVAEPDERRKLRAGIEPTTRITSLYDMREVLEVPAALWAAERADPASIARIQQALTALDSYVSTRGADDIDLHRLQALDLEFHASITEAAGNDLLLHTQSVIYDMVLDGMRSTLLMPGRLEGAKNEHGAILEAIKSQQPDVAANAARQHIRGARAAALRRLDDQNDEFSSPREV